MNWAVALSRVWLPAFSQGTRASVSNYTSESSKAVKSRRQCSGDISSLNISSCTLGLMEDASIKEVVLLIFTSPSVNSFASCSSLNQTDLGGFDSFGLWEHGSLHPFAI